MRYSNSNWNLYRTFITVFETRNLHRTAEMLGLSRPAISHNIKELSNQLGAKLFIPHTKGVEPTSEAITLYPSIKKCVEEIIDAEQSIQEFSSDSKAVIKMAMSSPMANIQIQKYFGEFCGKYKNVQFEFYKNDRLDLLEQRKIDFIIDIDYLLNKHNFQIKDVYIEEFILIASKSFLENQGLGTTITKEQFSKLPFVGHQKFIMDFADKTGLEVKPFVATQSSDLVHAIVKNGLGIGLYFRQTFNTLADDTITQVTIKDVTFPPIKMVCAYNKGAITKAAKVFLDGLLADLSKNCN